MCVVYTHMSTHTHTHTHTHTYTHSSSQCMLACTCTHTHTHTHTRTKYLLLSLCQLRLLGIRRLFFFWHRGGRGIEREISTHEHVIYPDTPTWILPSPQTFLYNYTLVYYTVYTPPNVIRWVLVQALPDALTHTHTHTYHPRNYVNVERGNAADKLNGRTINVSFTNNSNVILVSEV
jgi:hypothetical protein